MWGARIYHANKGGKKNVLPKNWRIFRSRMPKSMDSDFTVRAWRIILANPPFHAVARIGRMAGRGMIWPGWRRGFAVIRKTRIFALRCKVRVTGRSHKPSKCGFDSRHRIEDCFHLVFWDGPAWRNAKSGFYFAITRWFPIPVWFIFIFLKKSWGKLLTVR